MNNLRYILGCLLFVLVSCNTNNKHLIDEDFIQIISENPIYSENIIPHKYALTKFFVQGDSGKILLLDPRELEEIYMEDYSSWKYKKFVRKSLNQQLVIKTNKGKTFELNEEVSEEYKNNGFYDFLDKYTKKIEDGQYMLNTDIHEYQLKYTIFYYAFINNYLYTEDDFLGKDYLTSIPLYIKEN